jgi:hypothetical protein
MPDRRSRKPFPDGDTTAIGLYDDIDCVDPLQMTSVTILSPIGGSWNAERGYSVKP